MADLAREEARVGVPIGRERRHGTHHAQVLAVCRPPRGLLLQRLELCLTHPLVLRRPLSRARALRATAARARRGPALSYFTLSL